MWVRVTRRCGMVTRLTTRKRHVAAAANRSQCDFSTGVHRDVVRYWLSTWPASARPPHERAIHKHVKQHGHVRITGADNAVVDGDVTTQAYSLAS